MKLAVSILFSVALIGTLYEGVRWAGIVPNNLLPTLPQIGRELIRNERRLMEAALNTLGSVLLSLAITLPLGFGVGLLMNLNRNFHDMLLPLLITLKSLPAVALIPFMVLFLRRPLEIQVALTVSICVLPVTLAAYSGLCMPSSALRHFAIVCARDRVRVFWLVTFPAAASELLLGFRITLPLAFVGTLVAEMSSGGSGGLGNTILTASNFSDLPKMFAAIIVVAVISTGSYISLVLLIQKLFPATREVWL